MIVNNLIVDEDLGDSNLMNSFKRSKTCKKYREIDNYFKRCLMANWVRCLVCNLEAHGLISHL